MVLEGVRRCPCCCGSRSAGTVGALQDLAPMDWAERSYAGWVIKEVLRLYPLLAPSAHQGRRTIGVVAADSQAQWAGVDGGGTTIARAGRVPERQR